MAAQRGLRGPPPGVGGAADAAGAAGAGLGLRNPHHRQHSRPALESVATCHFQTAAPAIARGCSFERGATAFTKKKMQKRVRADSKGIEAEPCARNIRDRTVACLAFGTYQ
jgi:hypothetical protein